MVSTFLHLSVKEISQKKFQIISKSYEKKIALCKLAAKEITFEW